MRFRHSLACTALALVCAVLPAAPAGADTLTAACNAYGESGKRIDAWVYYAPLGAVTWWDQFQDELSGQGKAIRATSTSG